ncbi:MAG: hypothetical protein Kow00114_06870 [Kiloniellaceae bacterium]
MSLDADRAYPKKNFNINDFAQALQRDWDEPSFRRDRSFRRTTELYDEWLKYFLAQENHCGTRLVMEIRKARQNQEPEPQFVDPFIGYKDSLLKVLPHLVFIGVDSKQRTLVFDTTGLELAFDQLSGGEREIAFLTGQIDRFGLRRGLFLLDEPELHLNADLIRSWVGFLTGTVETGQVWLATHSLEAVEAAGQNATFVLERNDETRKVDRLARLDQRPILSALSRAVGTPAFAISQLRFVFVEGDESIGERERFRRLSGLQQDIRFMESGSCEDVIRRVQVVKGLANEAEAGIRIGGIIDRDFRDEATVAELQENGGVFVLPVHEVENLFLHHATLAALLAQNGISGHSPKDLIREACDARAGSWIFQKVMATRIARTLPEMPSAAKELAKGLTWVDIELDSDGIAEKLVVNSAFGAEVGKKFRSIWAICVKSYEKRRSEDSLWKFCEGKQVLSQIARKVGFSDAGKLESAAFVLWESEEFELPQEVGSLRKYLAGL